MPYRYVDNFLCYLGDLLGEAAKKFPNVIISKDQQVHVRHVLEQRDIDSFKSWFIEKKVNELSFGGLVEILDYFTKKFEIVLISEEDDMHHDLIQAVGLRNILVHRRGIIDERFMKNVGESSVEWVTEFRLDNMCGTTSSPRFYSLFV